MFEDIGEPAPEFRDSENSKNATNNNTRLMCCI